MTLLIQGGKRGGGREGRRRPSHWIMSYGKGKKVPRVRFRFCGGGVWGVVGLGVLWLGGGGLGFFGKRCVS